MKIGAVGESWLVRTPVVSPVVRSSIFRCGKPQLRFPLSNRLSRGLVLAVHGGREYESPWDEKPYETLPTGKRVYFDESDVVTFLDPPKELIPLDPASYNPSAYLWKKIEDIPEERRHHLLQLLEPRLISRAWEIASTRYEDPKLAKKTASKIFSTGDEETSLEYFSCRTSQGPLIISWINFFRMAVFRSNNGQIYGRVCGGPVVSTLANALSPLYFEVTEAMEVMATEEPCDVACKFGDGLLTIEPGKLVVPPLSSIVDKPLGSFASTSATRKTADPDPLCQKPVSPDRIRHASLPSSHESDSLDSASNGWILVSHRSKPPSRTSNSVSSIGQPSTASLKRARQKQRQATILQSLSESATASADQLAKNFASTKASLRVSSSNNCLPAQSGYLTEA